MKRARKNFFLFLPAIFFVLFFSVTNHAFGQKNGSIYFSVGYNESWYLPATIHVDQGELGNSYNMVKVKGDDKIKTPISLLHLNYRFGYFFNYFQTLGVELNFDPVNYRIKDGESINLKGTINDVTNQNEHISFSAKNGYYYYFNGANLVLVNVVRRFKLFELSRTKKYLVTGDAPPNLKKAGLNLRVDAIAKAGAGPALPHFENSLPINPVADPQLQYGGWNVGAEGGIRITAYRYGFLEITGKYDYARLNALNVYEGTARQNLQTLEVIASVGFTLPTTKNNPLFRHDKVVTILPFYQQAKLLKDEADTSASKEMDTTDHNKFRVIPEFQDILDKEAQEADDRYRRLHPPDTFNNMDSIAHADSIAQMDSIAHVDSIATSDSLQRVNDSLESLKPRKHRRHKHDQDSTLNNAQQPGIDSIKQAMTDSVNTNGNAPPVNAAPPPVAPPPVAPPPTAPPEPPKAQDTTTNSLVPPGEEKLSKKEEKKKAKEEKKEAKKKEKEEREKAKQAEKEAKEKAKAEEEAAKQKAQEEEDAKKKAEQEKADKEKQDTPPPAPENKDGN